MFAEFSQKAKVLSYDFWCIGTYLCDSCFSLRNYKELIANQRESKNTYIQKSLAYKHVFSSTSVTILQFQH